MSEATVYDLLFLGVEVSGRNLIREGPGGVCGCGFFLLKQFVFDDDEL